MDNNGEVLRGLTRRPELPEECFVTALLLLSADFQTSDPEKALRILPRMWMRALASSCTVAVSCCDFYGKDSRGVSGSLSPEQRCSGGCTRVYTWMVQEQVENFSYFAASD